VVFSEVVSRPKIEIPPLVNAYLEALADLGVYGDTAGRVATFILRKEFMRLIESGRLDLIPKKFVEPRSKAQVAAKVETDEEGEEDS
jgi:hypothetical protein